MEIEMLKNVVGYVTPRKDKPKPKRAYNSAHDEVLELFSERVITKMYLVEHHDRGNMLS